MILIMPFRIFSMVVIFATFRATIDIILRITILFLFGVIYLVTASNGRTNVVVLTSRINIIRFNRIYDLCLWSNFRDSRRCVLCGLHTNIVKRSC